MKKLFSAAVILSILVSCHKEIEPVIPAVSGDEVQFGVSKASTLTKTIYADEDDIAGNGDAWDLLWVEGDQVRVYCEQASVKEAPYLVHADVKALEKTEAAGIQWGDTEQLHDFYAVYPNDSKLINFDQENHIVEFSTNNHQVVKVKAKEGSNYTTSCDMSNAYMVAKHLEVDPQTTNVVGLTFDPVMTTLKITVRGPEDNGAAQFITGVSVTTLIPSTVNGTFHYSLDSLAIVSSEYWANEPIFVTINDSDNISGSYSSGVNGIELGAGETITLEAFIPPVLINEDNPVKIRVHSTGSIGAKSVTARNTIRPASKRIVKLPELPTEKDGNNWITPLDDNVYVSQLSIPGTHDACTSEGLSYEGITNGLAKTQTESVSDQWDMGIRAFDFRPAQYNPLFSSTRLQMYHGVVRINISFDAAMNLLVQKLNAHPGEFAIVIMRHESEIGDLPVIGQNQSKWTSLMYTSLNSIKDKLVMFRPDLTVGDCRGKILVLSRDQYDNGPIGGYMTGWGFGPEGAVATATGPDGSTCSIDVQDYYDCIETAESVNGIMVSQTKINAVKSMLRKSAAKTDYRSWTINHTSGYTSSAVSLEGYRDNAAGCNPAIYEFLTGEEWLAAPGPIGLMMMDFVGARVSGSKTVYGDLLPQVIIDNNYKYHMRRKGE